MKKCTRSILLLLVLQRNEFPLNKADNHKKNTWALTLRVFSQKNPKNVFTFTTQVHFV